MVAARPASTAPRAEAAAPAWPPRQAGVPRRQRWAAERPERQAEASQRSPRPAPARLVPPRAGVAVPPRWRWVARRPPRAVPRAAPRRAVPRLPPAAPGARAHPRPWAPEPREPRAQARARPTAAAISARGPPLPRRRRTPRQPRTTRDGASSVSPAAARPCPASSVRRLRPSRGRPGSSSRRPSSGRAERRSGIAGDVVQQDARQRPGVPVRDEEPVTLELEDGAARRAVEETRLRPMVRAGAPEESLQAAHAARRLARDRSDCVEVAPEDVRAPEPGAVEERAVDGERRVADDECRAGGGEADDGCVPDAVGAGDVQLEYRREVERAQQGAVGRYQHVREAAADGRAGEGARVRGLARSERADAPRRENGFQGFVGARPRVERPEALLQGRGVR